MDTIAKLDLPAQTLESADARARQILVSAQKQVGFIPNMYANMVNSPGLLETYLLGYGLFRQESGFSPAEQEVVFLAISRENTCDYCMAAHSTIADSVVAPEVLHAIREGSEIPDVKLRALATFTQVMTATRGSPTPAQLDDFRRAGYTDREALEIVLAIAVKTLSNYSNHLFHTEVDAAFAAYAWSKR